MKPGARSDDEPAGSMVFVVDDDDAMRESLRSLIRSAGLNVEAFSSARAFLRHEVPAVPTCLVLDVRMPGLSGLDLQHELAHAKRQIPIIFVTGHTYFFMLLLASFNAASGVALPVVAISNAAFIELQNLPI